MPASGLLYDVRLALVVLCLLAVPWLVPSCISGVVSKENVAAVGVQEVRMGRGVARFSVPDGFQRSLATNRDFRLFERGSQRIGVRIVSGVRDPEAAALRYVHDRIEHARIDAPLRDARFQGYRCRIVRELSEEGECMVVIHRNYLVAVTSTTTDASPPIDIEDVMRNLRVVQE